MLLLGVLVALWLLGGLWSPLRDPLWLVLATAVLSVVLSYFVLRVPRQAMTQQIAERLAARPSAPVADEDAAAEDAEVASAEGQPQTQQDAVGELGAAGVTQHGDEPETRGVAPDDPKGRPQQQS